MDMEIRKWESRLSLRKPRVRCSSDHKKKKERDKNSESKKVMSKWQDMFNFKHY